MIELIDSGHSSPYHRYHVRIDDEVFEESSVRVGITFDETKNQIELVIRDKELSKHVAADRFTDIPQLVRRLELTARYSALHDPDMLVQEVIIRRNESDKFTLSWDIHFYLVNWNEAYSVLEYLEEFTGVLDRHGLAYERNPILALGLSVMFPVENSDSTIEVEFFSHQEEMQKLNDEAVRSLSTIHHESISMFFDFPDEVKVPCEQYLLYFGRFLKDLGVKADTALTDEAGQVLFTVTPADEKDALDKIRTALDVFLHLPSSPVADEPNESMAVQRLEANILRFRSDLKLAAAELQAKETTIEAQRLIIDVQKGMLNGEILVDSMKNVTPKPEDKEDLIEGVVALSTYKDKGLELHLERFLDG